MIKYLKRWIRTTFPFLKNKSPNWFLENYSVLKEQEAGKTSRFTLSKSDFYPCLSDQRDQTPFDRHYLYHPAWAARVLAATKPAKHVDISSTLYFSTILSAFINTEFYDYRPASIELPNLVSARADLTNLFFDDSSILSLSCMHTVEHIGLGRYGDPIDYDGDLKAMHELARVLAPGGTLLFVTPIGYEAKIQFNAHRIYTALSVKTTFEHCGLTLKEFAYIPETQGGLRIESVETFITQDAYGCGCFWFTK